MKHTIKSCLQDTIHEITSVEIFMKDCKTLAEFSSETMRKKAIFHSLIVIGEAVNRIRKLDRSTQLKHINNIVGLRSHLTHAYDSIEDTIIYATVVRHLPLLKQEITTLLTQS